MEFEGIGILFYIFAFIISSILIVIRRTMPETISEKVVAKSSRNQWNAALDFAIGFLQLGRDDYSKKLSLVRMCSDKLSVPINRVCIFFYLLYILIYYLKYLN